MATPTIPAPAAAEPTGSSRKATRAKPAKRDAAQPNVRDSYNALTLAERISLQSDLAWAGHYNGPIDGEYSDRLVAAVRAFQKQNRNKDTGVLNPQERAALTAVARPLQQDVGWRIVQDGVTGARIGLPAKLAPNVTNSPNGTHWASAQGQLQIETFRIRTGATLAAVFEQQKREPVTRRTNYSVLKPDFFVVSGTQSLKKFYVRASAQNGEVRGITIMYDQAMEGTMDSIVVAMSSAFVPFPGSSAIAQDEQGPRRKVEYGTGVVVSNAGHIVTDRQVVDGCSVIVVPGYGNAERVPSDKTSDLALIRLYGARHLTPIGLIGARPQGDDVTLVGIADPQSQAGEAVISTASAKLGPGANERPLDTPPPPGFFGAAAIDRQGQLAGVVVSKPAVIAGGESAPAPQAAVVPTAKLIPYLDASYVAPASGKPGVNEARASVVRVICVRQ